MSDKDNICKNCSDFGENSCPRFGTRFEPDEDTKFCQPKLKEIKAIQRAEKAEAKVKELESLLWYIKAENSYCVVCLEDHPEYEDDMTDNDYLKTCKPDCKLANILKKPEGEL